jgi:PAS domain S-box-containing protein
MSDNQLLLPSPGSRQSDHLWKTIKRWLTAPVFDDPDRSWRARLFFSALYVTLALNVVDVVVGALLFGLEGWTPIVNIGSLGFQLALLAMVRRGWVRAAATLLCALVWIGITRILVEYHGILDPMFGSYLLTIAAAGLMIGGRSAIFFAAISTLVGLGLLLRSGSTIDGQGVLVTMTSLFAAMAYLLVVSDRATRLAFAYLRRDERALAELNEQLYTEIAGHLRAQLALRESEERYRLILEASPVALLVFRLSDGQLVYVNPATTRLFAATERDTMVGKTVREFILPHPPEQLIQLAARGAMLQSGQPTPPAEYHLRRIDGTTFWAEVGSIPIRYQDQPSALVVIVDMSDRRRAEEQRLAAERLRVEVEQQQRIIQMKDHFVSRVSHEFRTPLTVISTSNELLQHYMDRISPERRDDHFNKIRNQARFMEEMLDDLLTLSKARAGLLEFNPRTVDLAHFTRELMAEFEERYAHTHHFHLIAEGADTTFPVDERLLRHMLNNLLVNAVKYSPDGGQVRVELRTMPDEARIVISDQGIGIPNEHRERLFETFYRAPNVGKIPGTGLGLSIVRESVDAHGGTIHVVSIPGQGTAFTIRLPRRKPQPAPILPGMSK